MLNDTLNEHVCTVNKRESISEKTGDLNSRPKELRSEIINHATDVKTIDIKTSDVNITEKMLCISRKRTKTEQMSRYFEIPMPYRLEKNTDLNTDTDPSLVG